MTISPGYNEIRAVLPKLFEWFLLLGKMKNSAKCGDAMPIEPGNNVIDPAMGGSTGGFILDEFDDRDLLDLPKKRQRVAHRTARLSSVPPGDRGAF
jgi:hypothetical protein